VRRAALLLVAVACSKSGTPDARRPPDAPPARELIRVEQIVVEAEAWPPEAGPPLDDRALAGRVWEGLMASPDFEAARGPQRPPEPGVRRRKARIKVIYGVQEQQRVLRGGATMAVELADEEGPEVWESLACEGEVPKDPKQLPAAAAALVECAIERGARGLVEKAALRHAELPAILAALDGADPALRQVAFATIGERHLSAAVPRLIELLHSSDELVRDGAIGALVALRDPRAVKALTDLAQFKDLDLMRRIIDAVGTIGGDDARAYLELVAEGHDVPIIRELAQQALEDMARRRADGGR
jgi:hypothetical protein